MFQNAKISRLFLVGMIWLVMAVPARSEDAVADEASSMKKSLDDDKVMELMSAPAGVFDVEYADGRIDVVRFVNTK